MPLLGQQATLPYRTPTWPLCNTWGNYAICGACIKTRKTHEHEVLQQLMPVLQVFQHFSWGHALHWTQDSGLQGFVGATLGAHSHYACVGLT